MRKRFALIFCFGSLLALTEFSSADAQVNTVKEIAKGVWFRQGDIEREGHCNNAIIEMKDGFLIVDANFPSGARLVMNDVKKLSSKPIKWVFDTHHHGDHAYANAVWTKAGAETWGHAGVVDEMKKYEPKRWRETRRLDTKELNLDTAEMPQKTFTKSPHVIDDGTRRVEFHHFGWAHTRGDGFVYLPKEKILCTGDAATNGAYNFTADGNIKNWPSVMAKAEKLAVDHVLPGHGPAGGKEILRGERMFMESLYRTVQAEVKKGKKLEDLVTLEKGEPKKTSIKLGDEVKNWVGGPLPSQVRDAYREITDKKPAGDLAH